MLARRNDCAINAAHYETGKEQMNNDMQPVIIGVGQQTWREQNLEHSPVDALQAVTTAALSDTGSVQVIGAVDALVHIPFIMNQVAALADHVPRNPGAALAERIGLRCAQYTGDVGGDLPQKLLSEFASRLVRGEHQVVMLCGVELLATFLGAIRSGAGIPPWETGRDDQAECLTQTPGMTAATEEVHGLFEPTNAYPLFESALRHSKGHSAQAHAQLLGGLVSRMSTVAASNPLAWNQKAYTPQEVVEPGPGNRMISYPYTKVMNAIIGVDQAAALVLTTVGKARALGVDPERWIYLRGTAATHDSWFLGERASLHESQALRIAAQAALLQSGLSLSEMDFFDLYSCFPSAVQIACDALELSPEDPRGLTVTGGLNLFGGPGNNYSMHAIAQLVSHLRGTEQGSGLVSATGGYMTKHAVGIYSRRPPQASWAPPEATQLQAQVDLDPGPPLVSAATGSIIVEAHTVRFDRSGPKDAVLLGRLKGGERCVAVCDDASFIRELQQADLVGQSLSVAHSDGINEIQI